MNVICSGCAAELEIAEPAGPSPGGTVAVQCATCGARTEVPNPQGDETLYFANETWLIPVVDEVEGARGTTKRVIVRYLEAEPGDPGAVRFGVGEGVQRRLLPPALLEAGSE